MSPNVIMIERISGVRENTLGGQPRWVERMCGIIENVSLWPERRWDASHALARFDSPMQYTHTSRKNSFNVPWPSENLMKTMLRQSTLSPTCSSIFASVTSSRPFPIYFSRAREAKKEEFCPLAKSSGKSLHDEKWNFTFYDSWIEFEFDSFFFWSNIKLFLSHNFAIFMWMENSISTSNLLMERLDMVRLLVPPGPPQLSRLAWFMCFWHITSPGKRRKSAFLSKREFHSSHSTATRGAPHSFNCAAMSDGVEREKN